MYKFLLLSLIAAVSTATASYAADAVIGKQKAIAACAGCHGDENNGGAFLSLQLGGRNADKMVVKTLKYRNGKQFSPLMMMAALKVSEADIADIAAYYQSMGKPAFTAPYFQVKGDDDAVAHHQAAIAAPAYAPSYSKDW